MNTHQNIVWTKRPGYNPRNGDILRHPKAGVIQVVEIKFNPVAIEFKGLVVTEDYPDGDLRDYKFHSMNEIEFGSLSYDTVDEKGVYGVSEVFEEDEWNGMTYAGQCDWLREMEGTAQLFRDRSFDK